MSRYEPNPGRKITTRPKRIRVADSGGNGTGDADPGDALKFCGASARYSMSALLSSHRGRVPLLHGIGDRSFGRPNCILLDEKQDPRLKLDYRHALELD